jgi:hypothetical protein
MVADYCPRAMEAIVAMGGWSAGGKLKTREDVVQGLDTFPVMPCLGMAAGVLGLQWRHFRPRARGALPLLPDYP